MQPSLTNDPSTQIQILSQARDVLILYKGPCGHNQRWEEAGIETYVYTNRRGGSTFFCCSRIIRRFSRRSVPVMGFLVEEKFVAIRLERDQRAPLITQLEECGVKWGGVHCFPESRLRGISERENVFSALSCLFHSPVHAKAIRIVFDLERKTY
jgi:hypothetical protein